MLQVLGTALATSLHKTNEISLDRAFFYKFWPEVDFSDDVVNFDKIHFESLERFSDN